MSTPKTSITNHYLLESELSPKVNIAMSTEEIPANGNEYNSEQVRRMIRDKMSRFFTTSLQCFDYNCTVTYFWD